MEHESALVFEAGHPAFAGHFPGAPIVPGVLLLDAALHAAQQSGLAVTGIASAKFLHPVAPDEALGLSLKEGGTGRASFEIRAGTQPAASGQLLVGARQ
jgi:3-hydroxyacyl-[acyl-carrier-protein] dehydratase